MRSSPPRGTCARCKAMWGNIVLFRHTQTFVSLLGVRISGFLLSARPDKGPLQTRSSQGCHLLANMLSVIFCALGSPSGAGPHGSPAHANRTNPSRTCLSVSLSPSFPLSPSHLSPPLLSSTFARQCVSLSCLLALSSISLFVHLFPLLSPSLSLRLRPRRQCWGCVSANCSEGCVSLCVFPCVLADSPSSLILSSSPRDGRQLSVAPLPETP